MEGPWGFSKNENGIKSDSSKSIARWALFGKIFVSPDLQVAGVGNCSGDLQTGHKEDGLPWKIRTFKKVGFSSRRWWCCFDRLRRSRRYGRFLASSLSIGLENKGSIPGSIAARPYFWNTDRSISVNLSSMSSIVRGLTKWTTTSPRPPCTKPG